MKTLAERVKALRCMAHRNGDYSEEFTAMAVEHDAVMAQMAEALRDYYSILEGIAPWMEIEGTDEYLKLKASRYGAQAALSAFQSLGEQS